MDSVYAKALLLLFFNVYVSVITHIWYMIFVVFPLKWNICLGFGPLVRREVTLELLVYIRALGLSLR